MRRFVLAVLVSALSLGAATATSRAADDWELLLAQLDVTALPAVPPPSFKLETLDGKPFGLADLRGRPALLYFWATW